MLSLLRRSSCFAVPRNTRRASSHALDLLKSTNAPVDIHPEVEQALRSRQPVVSLETTLVTHGLPYPVNLELSQSLEDIVRASGSIPATIGIIDGRIKIGLEPHELERLADTKKNPMVVKVSRRDIAPAIAMKADGGTTCSATLVFSALAGIKVFATGGLGGVHRGGESSMDISADLQELTRCPVGLVSAGVKSILDIGRTLEYLETLGVPVLTYGPTNDFPAFFSPRSGYKVPWNTNDPETAARILHAQSRLGMANGALIAVPIPDEYESAGAKIQQAVEQAISESEGNGMSKRGKDTTPWLLDRVAELTKGESLTNNIALLKNTALVGGQIAARYAKLAGEHDHPPVDQKQTSASTMFFADSIKTTTIADKSLEPAPKVIVVGSAALDISAQALSLPCAAPGAYTTSPGSISLTLGGVGRNIAEACHRLMVSHAPILRSATQLISAVGDDDFGHLLRAHTEKMDMRSDGLLLGKGRTSVCNLVLDSAGSLVGGVADMKIINSLNPDDVLQRISKANPAIVALDGNLSADTIINIVEHCNTSDIPVFFEPTSSSKSTAIFPAIAAALDKQATLRSPIQFSSPNILELTQMYTAARERPYDLTSHDAWWTVIDDFSLGSEFRTHLEQLSKRTVVSGSPSRGTLSFLIEDGVAQMAVNLLPFFQNLVIKCGKAGVIVAMRISGQNIERSGWINEQSNVHGRYVVAHGKKQKELVVLQHFPPLPLPEEDIVNVTGAGDSLVGAVLAGLAHTPDAFHDPLTLSEIIDGAQCAAILSLKSNFSVSPFIGTA